MLIVIGNKCDGCGMRLDRCLCRVEAARVETASGGVYWIGRRPSVQPRKKVAK